MNLINIKNNGEFFYTTPDTSLNRDSKDYFCPDFADEFAVVCFYYVRIEKNAKAVTEKFANRYISGFGYGIKLEALGIGGSQNPYVEFMASALDNTTYISPILSKEQFAGIKPVLKIDNTDVAVNNGMLAEFVLNNYPKAVSNITNISTLRSGDIIIFESEPCNKQRTLITRGCAKNKEIMKISFGEIDITFNW